MFEIGHSYGMNLLQHIRATCKYADPSNLLIGVVTCTRPAAARIFRHICGALLSDCALNVFGIEVTS